MKKLGIVMLLIGATLSLAAMTSASLYLWGEGLHSFVLAGWGTLFTGIGMFISYIMRDYK